MVGVRSLSTAGPMAFLTCNIGPLPPGVTLSPTSESCLLSEPPFSAERQGGPVQPLYGRGAGGPQCSWPVSVGKWHEGVNSERGQWSCKLNSALPQVPQESWSPHLSALLCAPEL